MVCMARFLSSNGRILTNFYEIHLKLSAHAYYEVRFHFILFKYDVTTNKLYCHLKKLILKGTI